MSEERYDPKKFALSLGFSEEDAELFGGVNANATNLRRLAIARGLIPETKEKAKDALEKAIQKGSVNTAGLAKVSEHGVVKSHKHFYRVDGTCKCGAVKPQSEVKKALAAPPADEKVTESPPED